MWSELVVSVMRKITSNLLYLIRVEYCYKCIKYDIIRAHTVGGVA